MGKKVDPSTPSDVKPGEEDGGTGAGWIIFWILFILLLLGGAGWWVKTRKEMGMPLNPFAKDYSFAAGYGASDDAEGMKTSLA